MFIVFDWNKTEAFGPFDTKAAAEDWLAKQGILLGQYEDQEVSIMELQDDDATLKEVTV